MHIDIILRAADPAGAAETLHRLGLRLDPPDRPNPDRWHGAIKGSFSIVQAGENEAVGLAIGMPDIAAAHGRPSHPNSRAGWRCTTVDVGGAPVDLVEDAGPVLRPFGDRLLALHAETVLRSARRELREVLERHGIERPVLVGPETLLGADAQCENFEGRFALLIENRDEDAIREIDEVLARHAVPKLRVETMAQADLDAPTLRNALRLGWDVVL